MKNDIAIQVKNVSKQFRVPHRKVDSVRNAFVNIFAPNRYEEFDALKDISFEVKKGEFLGIIGRNGAGKSTLLKTLAGIYKPDTGSITINGRISPFLELGIGFNPELSGRDNVYLNATVLGLSKEEIDAKFDEIVRFAELEDFIDQQLKNYSSGMQVRLAFSVSIHANRDILLMDEVLAVGDTSFQQKCLDVFRGYKEQGKTVILVTHSMDTVRQYCDRAILFHKGELIESGDVGEICEEYIIRNLINSSDELLEREGREEGYASDFCNKDVEIKKVEFLDEEKKIKTVFQPGDTMFIRVNFQINKKISLLNFGLGIYNKDNFHYCGFSTIRDKVNTEKCIKKGYYDLCLKNIPFNNGEYYLKLNIGGEDLVNYYDYIDKTKEHFKVFSPKNNPGGVVFDYTWK